MAADLAGIFRQHARSESEGPRDGCATALSAALASIVREGRAAWPEVDIEDDVFVTHIAEHWSEADVVAREELSASTLHAADLYLACACAAGHERAIAIFEERYISRIDHAVARLRLTAWATDETKQVLRSRLLLPSEDRRPRIADFTAHGELAAWVRAAAIRIALRVIELPRHHLETDSAVIRAVSAAGDDLETEYMKRRCASELEDALRAAFEKLPVRDRNMLRYYYAKNVGIDGVATLCRVHRATAARRIRRVTEQVIADARVILASVLRIDGAEISSVLRLIQSRIGQAFQRALARP